MLSWVKNHADEFRAAIESNATPAAALSGESVAFEAVLDYGDIWRTPQSSARHVGTTRLWLVWPSIHTPRSSEGAHHVALPTVGLGATNDQFADH
jgi:hypothetical protein